MELAVNIFYGNHTILWFDPLCQWFLKHTIKTIFKKLSCNPPKFRAHGQKLFGPLYVSLKIVPVA